MVRKWGHKNYRTERAIMKTTQLPIYMTFLYFFFNITKSLYPLCLLWLIISVHSWFKSEMLQKCNKSKTNPKRTQTKPIFQTPNLVLSEKTRILDKIRQYFFCKTNPFFSKIQIENKGLTAVSQSSARLFKNIILNVLRDMSLRVTIRQNIMENIKDFVN